jgi:hypothetical protein
MIVLMDVRLGPMGVMLQRELSIRSANLVLENVDAVHSLEWIVMLHNRKW